MDKRITKIKFCGITNLDDAMKAASLEIDMLGFVFTKSKRKINPEKAKSIIEKLPDHISSVGVFMNDSFDDVINAVGKSKVDMVQLHGKESADYCKEIERITGKKVIKRIDVSNKEIEEIYEEIQKYKDFLPLFDPGAGEGKSFDYLFLKSIKTPFIIAGGLTPFNVKKIVCELNPYGVDVSSGIEKEIGKKDFYKMKQFVREVRK